MKTFTLYLFYLSTIPCIAQIIEPRVESANQLIDSLAVANASNDTDNIIRFAAVLTTKLQATSNEKAATYLHLALQYARAHRDRKWYADVCNRAGMLMLSYANDPTSLMKLKRTAQQMQDSSLYWHRQAIARGLAIGRTGTAGWGYRGLMATAVAHYNKAVRDSILYYYYNAMVMAAITKDQELINYSNWLYADYLNKPDKTNKSIFDLEKTPEYFRTIRAGFTQEEHISGLIEILAHAESAKDTAKIISSALEIMQSLRLALIYDRATNYLHIAFRYAQACSDKKHLMDVYYYAGVLMPHLNKVDSAIYYHRKVITEGPLIGKLEKIGWAYKQLMSIAINYPNSNLSRDSILFYYNNAKTYATSLPNPRIGISADATYYQYLDQLGDLQKAGSVLQSMSLQTKQMDIGQMFGFYSSVHNHLAKTNELDTLIKIQKLMVDLLGKQTAATHQEQLYAKDQQYEVSKTRNTLEATASRLNTTNKALIISITILIVFASLIAYLFFLSRKNKKLSQRNELLLREQNHRVKNNLQMISSLLSLQSQKLNTSAAKEVLEESQSRINSVALLHRMLYEGKEVGKVEVTSYLRSLVDEIQYSAGRELKIELNLPHRLELQIEKVTSLGLIINELLTNSIKHVDRTIALEVKLMLLSNDEKLYLSYTDNGLGISKEIWMSSPSFGNQLIQMQSRQLRGEYEVSSTNGFMYSLKISA